MDEKFRQLIELGAGEFEHVNGYLITHLEGTRCLLKAWNASEELQDAGLYHAAYGTSAIVKNLFELSQRKDVANVIGDVAENIVYHYCVCDSNTFYVQFGLVETPVFYDRITTNKSDLSFEMLQQICELTAANEIEIAINNPDFVTQNGAGLVNLFNRMQPFLSSSAQRKIQHVFASHF
ncbi:MAG: hypothetical protein ACI936_001644 [Paraglaciecola sp.]|jgi:hypothetical protein